MIESFKFWLYLLAVDVAGRALPCGHFLPEEEPTAVADELLRFHGRSA